jgi:hypothetical protein
MKLFSLSNAKFSNGAVLALFSLAAILLWIASAIAQTCVEEQAGKSMLCNGNDVRVTFADNIRDISGAPLTQCRSGKTFSFIADFYVHTTAKARYDVGLYFAIDGDPNSDGATSGTCNASIIKERHMDPAFPNAVMLGAPVVANLDDDACGDLSSANGWRQIGGKVVTVRVDNTLCQDSDGDGNLNLPYCASWSPNPGGVCNSPENAAPTSDANCNCGVDFNLPIAVKPEAVPVTKGFHPDSTADGGGDLSLLSEPEIQGDSHP